MNLFTMSFFQLKVTSFTSAQWFGQWSERLSLMVFLSPTTRKYMIVDVPTEVLEEVAEITALAARMG